VGFETIHRSMDLFLVGHTWARQFAEAAASADRDAILLRFAHWNEMLRGWFFPQMMSYLLASASFVAATWRDVGRARWYCLAPIAYALNALRLLGRVSSNYLGQSWLNGLNENLYFPGVLVVNTLLVIWFLLVAKHEGTPGAQ